MKTHLDQLSVHLPDILKWRILDVGSGGGGFLIDVAQKGGVAIGIEKNRLYIDAAFLRAKEAGASIEIQNSVGEKMPFADNSFGFANASELIEHVENPQEVVSEMHRVLKNGSFAYVSVPNRFSVKDPHFHLYFVNWIPRRWADRFIDIFGSHKNYNGVAGRQRLSEMHYFTYAAAVDFFKERGFAVEDIREKKIKKIKMPQILIWPTLFLYRFLRSFLFAAFHFLLKKEKQELSPEK